MGTLQGSAPGGQGKGTPVVMGLSPGEQGRQGEGPEAQPPHTWAGGLVKLTSELLADSPLSLQAPG